MLFITEAEGVKNLIKEGISRKKIFLVGDTMIDSLAHYRKKINTSGILKKLSLKKGGYILSTIHRPVNVDNKESLERIISIFEKVSAKALSFDPEIKIVLPVHPRTLKMAEKFSLINRLNKIKNLVTTEPAGYTDFIKLLTDCKLVITDSGGIQEEATFLKIPCLTLRDSFERPETLRIGSNTLCGLNEPLVLKKISEIFTGKYKKGKIPRQMDGKASLRIVKAIRSYLY
jgi:UDP-N-acetylglucosamine 2-epimerase (non-hydrolysing)